MKRTATVLLPLLFAGCAERAPTSPTLATDPPSMARAGAAFTYVTIAVPGALATEAMGINAGGDIVGSYTDASRVTHGFLFRDGEFTTIDFPGAALTQARGIGPNGEIVGTYRRPGEPTVNLHGYLRTPEGEFIQVDHLRHINTMPQRILPDGTILGCRHDTDMMASMRGIAISRSDTSETGAFASMHNGATPDLRRIAGLYTNMMVLPNGRTEGYVIEDGVFRPFLVPGSDLTAAWDVSPQGDIVGVYRNATGVHGFLLRGDKYTSIDVPGASPTRAFGINARGDVVGSFVAGGTTFGFVATARGRPEL